MPKHNSSYVLPQVLKESEASSLSVVRLKDELSLLFFYLDSFGSNDIERLASLTCDACSEAQVFDPCTIQIETHQKCGGSYEINWRVIQGDS
ncbi:hypothetical protein N9M41_06620 [Rhodopirellula sp.]|nr:hypothetical protein [Rhodopirellula sp.]